MLRAIVIAAALIALAAPALGQSDTIRFGGWNITNLHHESGVPLRDGAKPRDDIDFDNLRQFAASLSLDIVALSGVSTHGTDLRLRFKEGFGLVA